MNTPVEFFIAKLLKEKGFDKPCREGWVNYLASFTGETRMPDDESNLVLDRLGNTHLIERPTIADVVMWLYDKHGVWVECNANNNVQVKSDWVTFDSRIIHKDRNVKFRIITNTQVNKYTEPFNSPTEAYEAAIEYSLKHLM